MQLAKNYISSILFLFVIVASLTILLYVKTNYIDNWPIEPSKKLIQEAQEKFSPGELEEFYILSIEANQISVSQLIGILGNLISFFYALLILFFINVMVMIKIIKKNNGKEL